MYSRNHLPRAISHRGLHARHAENSIPAFLAAIEAGADGIELDVHASADGVPFVHHDPDAVTAEGSRAMIASLSASEIAGLRLPGGVGISTLEASLDAIGDACDVFVEIKGVGIEEAVVGCLRGRRALLDRYAVHSFDHRIVKRVTELLPSVRTGILQASYLIDSCAAMRRSGASDLWQHVDLIDASLVVDVHACGGRVIAWTSNTPGEWSSLSAMGVDGICANPVDDLIAWLRNRAGG